MGHRGLAWHAVVTAVAKEGGQAVAAAAADRRAWRLETTWRRKRKLHIFNSRKFISVGTSPTNLRNRGHVSPGRVGSSVRPHNR
jgi:hypothetical protein